MIQNKMFELVFQGEKPDGSEALADIKAVFTNGNSSQSVKGFYDGNGTYKVRFLPREAGVYSWKVTGAVEAEGQEECTASTQHGMCTHRAAILSTKTETPTFLWELPYMR